MNRTIPVFALAAAFAGVSFADDAPAAVATATPAPAAEPAAEAAAPAAEEAVAVRIDGKAAITVAELDEMADGIFARYAAQIPPAMVERARADIRKSATQNLIDQRLLVAEAAKLGLSVTPEEKFEALSEMTGGMTNLETIALMQGIAPEKFDRMFTESVLATKVVNLQTNGIADPTPEEAKARFDKIVAEHPEAARQPEEVRAAHILVLVDKGAPAEDDAAALAKIKGIRDRAVAGEDFGALAKEFSEDPGSKDNGGEYTFGRGRMVPEFEKAAFEQEIGVVGEPVRTSYGYHILKGYPGRFSQVRMCRRQIMQPVRRELRSIFACHREPAVHVEISEAQPPAGLVNQAVIHSHCIKQRVEVILIRQAGCDKDALALRIDETIQLIQVMQETARVLGGRKRKASPV